MRRTRYVHGYGYVTGNGLFDSLFKLATKVPVKQIVNTATKIASNPKVQDVALEAGKSFAKTAGTKAGNKLVDKIFGGDKKSTTNTNNPMVVEFDKVIQYKPEPKVSKDKPKPTQSKDLLKQIYGDGLFRQTGRGLKRI